MQLHAQYYYQQLPPQERAAYHGMLTCLRELTPSARIPRLPMETLSTLFFQLRLDHPEIFYAVGFSCRAVPEAAFVEFWPEYRFEKKRIREHRQAIEARVTRLLRPLRSLPPAEQERAIHDFVVENVRYDKLEKPYSHEVIGPLTNGVGVCEGMAKTVKLLCDGLGLPCMIAVSDRDRANGERYLHAWNIVQLGGQCYHLDATFDNSLSKYGTRYDYFNLDDTKIFRDHRPLLYPAPPCTDGGQFYYKLQHLSWTKPEEVARRVDQALRKKQPGLVFHWRGGYLTREVLAELCLQIDAAAQARGVMGVGAVRRERGLHLLLNFELLAAMRPDLMLLYGVTGENTVVTGKLRELGIPYIYIGDYMEESPLGKAEWLMVAAELCNVRDKGAETFRGIAARYNALKNRIAKAARSPRPKVMLNTPYRDTWFMPSSRSFMVRLIEDAGGEYVYTKNASDTSVAVDLEEAYLLASSADTWINVGPCNTLAELTAQNPKFADVPAVSNRQVFNNNRRQTPARRLRFLGVGRHTPRPGAARPVHRLQPPGGRHRGTLLL